MWSVKVKPNSLYRLSCLAREIALFDDACLEAVGVVPASAVAEAPRWVGEAAAGRDQRSGSNLPAGTLPPQGP
jgi:hypothetical protein